MSQGRRVESKADIRLQALAWAIVLTIVATMLSRWALIALVPVAFTIAICLGKRLGRRSPSQPRSIMRL